MLIGYQGIEGSYSEMACREFAGDRAYERKGYPTFKALVDDLMREEVDYIALPVENSTSGPITRTIDLMKYLEVEAVKEVYVKIDHALITRQPAAIGDLTEVYSHPEALEQCYRYLSRHPHLAIREYSDTAGAVRMVKASNDSGLAAIAGCHAADMYGMHVADKYISDNPYNTTRFLFFRKLEAPRRENREKTSLYIETDHSTGSLNGILNIFSTHGINLLNLTSRPIQNKPFSYGFFIDVEEGDASTLDDALRAIGEVSRYINILGTYQKGEVPSYGSALINE